jgi:dTDP-4-dehydrorhamnose 3,5-epimerase
MPFTFTPLDIPEVILIKPKVFPDNRGFFMELYKSVEFKANGIEENFVQDNFSESSKGVLRGLHYQCNPMAQGKLVTVLSGSIFDVAVDIRRGSPTFGQWVSAILSAENKQILWVPPGFAHGVLVLEDNTHLLYKVTELYSPECDRAIRWNDPAININWPAVHPELSDKDQNAPFLTEADNNFVYM